MPPGGDTVEYKFARASVLVGSTHIPRGSPSRPWGWEAKKRFITSKASASSPSSTTLRSRRRSRTSSAGGDGFGVDKGLKKSGNDSDSKSLPRSAKYNMRQLSNHPKGPKKMLKPVKPYKPAIESLQNTIVLAPFHALKKNFQNKLIHLYSKEKIKKINHEMKMAKKPNTSFEYDIIELKPVEQKNVKKEEKNARGLKSRGNQNEAEEKRTRPCDSRSLSYCQCDKKKVEFETGSERKRDDMRESEACKQRTRRNRLSLEDYHFSQFCGPSEPKKRRFGHHFLNPTVLKAEINTASDYLDDPLDCTGRSDTNLSLSAISSRSNPDSWETFSNPSSCREEHLAGSLALSTTSLNSCLEQFVNTREIRSGGTNRLRSKYKTRLTMVKENGKNYCEENVGRAADLLPKPKKNDSRHFFLNDKTKLSDSRISDFMDREPQSHLTSVDTLQHVQPLRRQSKTKAKRQCETESHKVYNLRSVNCEKDEISLKQAEKNILGAEDKTSTVRRADPCKSLWRKSTIDACTETATQIEHGNRSGERNTGPAKNPSTIENHSSQFLLSTPSQTVLSGRPESDVPLQTPPSIKSASGSESREKETGEKVPRELEFEVNAEPSKPFSSQAPDKSVTSNKTDEQDPDLKSIKSNKEEKNESRDYEKNMYEREPLEVGDLPPGLPPGPPPGPLSGQLSPDSPNMFHKSPAPRGVSQEPKDKEPDFIFGTANPSARLGESCEFSFGLSWKISDEDDSDHDHDFF